MPEANKCACRRKVEEMTLRSLEPLHTDAVRGPLEGLQFVLRERPLLNSRADLTGLAPILANSVSNHENIVSLKRKWSAGRSF